MQAAAGRLNGIITPKVANVDVHSHEQSKVSLNNATVKIGYRARPLNGIWATTLFTTGLCRRLRNCLNFTADRVKSFHVGSQEYHPVNVGFKDDPDGPVFDTTTDGNSNAGHEYGGKLSDQERKDLLEYLKSL